MFAIFYGSLEDSIPFPFLRLFQLQIPLGNDYFPIALCWVFASCPMCMCEQDKLVWPPIASTLNLSRWLKRLDIVKLHLTTPGAAAQLFPLKGFLFPPHPPELPARPWMLHVSVALASAWVTESPILLLATTFPKPQLNWRISEFIAESRLKVFSPSTNPQFKNSNYLTQKSWKPYSLHLTETCVLFSGLTKCARPTLFITTRFWELIALHLKCYGCPLRFLCLWTPTPAIHSVPGSWRNDLIPSLMGPKALTSSPASPTELINRGTAA